MIKLLVFATLAAFACRALLGKWPWEYLRAKPPGGRAVQEARALLGLRQGASRDAVVEAHRRRLAIVHPDRGGTDAQVHEANAARDLLLDHLPDSTPGA